MIVSRKNIVLLIGVIFIQNCFSQKYITKHFDLISGLSNSDTYCCYQDYLGFIWIGTKDGLNRYDGVEFRTYHSNTVDTTSLSGNLVNMIIETGDKKLWLLTNTGVSVYNREFENFIRIKTEISATFFTDATVTKSNQLIFAAKEGIFVYNQNNNTIEKHFVDEKLAINNTRIITDRQGLLWIASQTTGIYTIDGQLNIARKNLLTPDGKVIVDFVSFELELKGDTIWTSHNGILYCYNRQKDIFEPYRDKIHHNIIKFEGLLRHIFIDKQGKMWLSADNEGVWTYEINTGTLTHIKSYPANENTILKPHKVFQDNAGNFWTPTALGVHYVYLSEKESVKILNKDNPGNLPYISSNIISSFCKQKDGILWIGSDGEGLNRYDPSTGKMYHYLHNGSDTKSIGANSVLVIYEDSKSNVWVGGYLTGLCIYSPKFDNFRVFKNDPKDSLSLSNNDVRDIIEDKNGNIWVITNGGGLNLLISKEKGKFRHFSLNSAQSGEKRVDMFGTCLNETKNGQLLVGTYSGFSLFDYADNSFINFESKPENPHGLKHAWIIDMEKDSLGNFWLGTGAGLHYFNPITKQIIAYDNIGLANNMINGIARYKNRLYVTTGLGLQVLEVDYDNGKPVLSNIKKIKSVGEGGYAKFFPGSSYIDDQDNIYFGSRNGLIHFHPDSMVFNRILPPVYFTDFLAFYESVPIAKPGSPITRSIGLNPDLRIPPEMSVITFRFAALNYFNSDQNNYFYRLLPIDKNWRNIENRNEITFANLSAGKYILEVRGTNNDGHGYDNGPSVTFEILPPWYKAWWLRTLVILFLFMIVSLMYAYKVYLFRTREKRLTQLVKERTHDLLDANQLLEERQEEVIRQKEELQSQKEHIEEMFIKLEANQNQILAQNQELTKHRCRLEELIGERTRELEIALKKSQESDKLKMSFLNNLSHEIRTPLNAIIGFGELIASETKLPSHQHYISILQTNADALLRMINNVLDISLIESGTLSIACSEVNAYNLAIELFNYTKNMLVNVKDKTVNAGIIFNNIGNPKEEMMVKSDPVRLNQILFNLVDNAIKFTHVGSIEIVCSRLNGNHLQISIRDTGIGIEEENKKIIFENFRKIEENTSKLYRGIGIGLSLAKRLSVMLNCQLSVESEFGKGSIFSVTIPLASHETSS